MKTLPKRSTSAAIDMSPLIDMVFILLIFFVVSSTFVKDAAVDLKRPGAKSGAEASSKALRVALDAQGGLWLDGSAVKPWMLQSRLRDAFRDGADKEVLVVADRAVAVQKLVEVVDQCRLAGASDVTVATEKEFGG